MTYSGGVSPSGVYRTEQGKTLRITEADDGALKVEVLQQGEWTAGSVRMVGLRLSPTTTRVTGAELRALPA